MSREARLVTPEEARERLQRFVDRHGSQTQAARAAGVCRSYLTGMLNGKADISVRVLPLLGLRRVEVILETGEQPCPSE